MQVAIGKDMNDEQYQGERPEDLLSRLNSGERRCLELVAAGMGSKQIGRELGLSPHTVDDRVRTTVRKLNARNRLHAAQILTLASAASAENSLKSVETSRLRYEDSDIPPRLDRADKEALVGEGDGPVDLRTGEAFKPEFQDSGRARSWLEPSHPLAKFFGGENKLSIGRRLLVILAIAVGTAVAFTALLNTYVQLSRLFSSS